MNPAPRQGIRAAIANIGWLSFDRVIRLGGSLFVGTLVARYLEPSLFGLYNLAIAIYMLFNTASGLGLDYLVVRDMLLEPDALPEILGTAFWMKVAASLLTTMAATVFAWLTHRNDGLLILMVALLSAAGISQALDVIDFFFQARTLSRLTVVPRLLTFVAANVARVLAVVAHAGLLTFVLIGAAEILVGELALTISYRHQAQQITAWRIRMTRAKALLRQSWPLVIAGLLIMLYMRTDQILLGYLLGNRAVGIYSAAVRLSEIWYVIPVMIANTVMPRLLPAFQGDRALYYRRLQIVYNGLVLISVALALCTMPVSRFVVTLMFGAKYSAASSILNIHIWTGVFVFLGALSTHQMVHENLTAVELRRALAGAVINIALNLYLIPRFGMIGSAWATLAAQATATYFSDLSNRNTWHMFRMKSYALSGLWLFRGGLNWRQA